MVSRRLPSIFYNWITLIGVLVGALSFIMIVLLYLIDTFVQGTTIYLGLVTFIILPVFVLLGMLLIAVGALVEHRRRARGRAPSFSLTIQIDLRNPAHVTTLLIWAVGTVVFLLASSAGTYRAYQVTEWHFRRDHPAGVAYLDGQTVDALRDRGSDRRAA